MIRNYLLIAWRNIFRSTIFSTINILGLAFGLASALLIFLWIGDELRVDSFHQNSDRLFRVMENQTYAEGKVYTFAATPGPMAPVIKQKYPEIEKATRFTWPVNNLFQYGDESFYEEGHYAEQDFLDMFTFPLVAGDPATALGQKNSIVISRAFSDKFFKGQDPLGKIISMNNQLALTVTGVFDEIPASSSLKFDYLLPFEIFWDENISWLNEWGNNNIRTFLMLGDGVDKAEFEAKLRHEVREHNENTVVELFLQPYSEMYLYGDFENGVQSGGRIEYVRIFFIVALFVLFIACINFMNLATAQATRRAKEVGLRKVMGAIPSQLFRQFMGESFLLVVMASVAALGICFALLPLFNELTGKELSMNLIDPRAILVFIAIVIVTSFVAGSFPALFLSDYKPAQVLKGQMNRGERAAVFRKALVVVQFSLSIILIVSTIVVYQQMKFMENRDIGFDRNNVFYAWMDGDIPEKFDVFQQELLKMPGIANVTASSQLPINVGNSTSSVEWEGKDPENKVLFSNIKVDPDFIQTMRMQMVEGRAFDRARVTDSTAVIVNQQAAEKFGFTDGVAGKEITLFGDKVTIIGVVKDFNFGSLHAPIDPLILYTGKDLYGVLLVRVEEGETAAALRETEKIWKQFAPGYPFSQSFLNQDWEGFYASEDQRGKIFNTLAVLSIFISCLGLFGLSAFSAARRTRELGIRKTLGASVPSLVKLMSREFSLLVLTGALIGCPVAWYLMSSWLANYAYHIDVNAFTFIIATFVCLILAMATVGYHSVRVAMSDPVKSLRYE